MSLGRAVSLEAPVAIHVIWHPGSKDAEALAEAVFTIFRNNVTQLQGGLGIPVFFYSEPRDRTLEVPRELRLDAAHRHIVVLLIDEALIDAVDGRTGWADYVADLRAQQQEPQQLIPVTLCGEAIDFCNRQGLPNAIRWHFWASKPDQEKLDRLAVHLIPILFDFVREELGEKPDPQARKKVRLFLSHAKADGRDWTLEFRSAIQSLPGLGDFFDEVDILPGEKFEDVLEREVERAAVLVVHTNAYASRDWCCWEVVAGKRFNVPIVAAHCIDDREDRAFPYLGNIPSIRVDKAGGARILEVVRRLLEEVLRQLLWRCAVEHYRALEGVDLADALDTWRSPELVWLMLSEEVDERIAKKEEAEKPDRVKIVVLYPDPPLGRNERSIIDRYKPQITLMTPTELMAE